MLVANKNETKLPFYISRAAWNDMRLLKTRVSNVRRRLDAVSIFCGPEGSGKSTLATQFAYAYERVAGGHLTLDDYYFTPNNLHAMITRGTKPAGNIFIYDEAVTGLLKTLAMTKMFIKLQIMFSTMRSKQYCLFVNIPRFQELPRWMAVDRSVSMYRTYFKKRRVDPNSDVDPLLSGYYVGYNDTSKEYFYNYLISKKFYEAKHVLTTEELEFSAWPWGRKKETGLFSYDEYENRKKKMLAEEDRTDLTGKQQNQRDLLIRYMILNLKVPKDDVKRATGMGKTAIDDVMRGS